MKVNNFSIQRRGKNTIFTADFIFSRPFRGREGKLQFYTQNLKNILFTPFSFLKSGFSVKHTIWYKIPTELVKGTPYADAFFIISVVLALSLDEDLYFGIPVSQEVAGKFEEIKRYYGMERKHTKIKVETTNPIRRKQPGMGQFFSLGLDSFFTLLSLKNIKNRKPYYLVFVKGYDIPLSKDIFMKTVHSGIMDVASKTESKAVFVETNLRQVSDKIVGWGVFHTAALAAVGTLLPFETMYINGETYDWPDWGLRYGVDALFSTQNTSFELFAHNVTRDVKIRKMQKLPQFDLFMKYVRTCWKNIEKTDVPYNCCSCQKCLRTQLTFLALGIHITPTFEKVDLKKLAKIELFGHVRNEWTIVYDLLVKKKGIDPALLGVMGELLRKPMKH